MNEIYKVATIVAAAAFLAGCNSSGEPYRTAGEPPPPVIIQEPVGQTVVSPLESTTPFRTPERIAIYNVGRTRDAVDSNVMHLEHQVARVERPSNWIKYEQGGGTHVRVTGAEDPLGEKAAEPTAADIELKVHVAGQMMQQLDQRNKVLVDKLDGFTKATEKAGQLKEENDKLKADQEEMKKRIEKMEKERAKEKEASRHFWSGWFKSGTEAK